MEQHFTYAPGFQCVRCGWSTGGADIGHIQLDRPASSNAFNATLWREFPAAVKLLQDKGTIRVAIITAAGKNFCAGLDLSYLTENFAVKMGQQPQGAAGAAVGSSGGVPPAASATCPARLRYGFRQEILQMQEAYSVLERCPFPVIAAVQGACVGAGVDLITAADLRYCSADAAFCVKEVDLAITADLGTLQRLPAIIGHGAAAELALTARVVGGAEAARLGLVGACYDSAADMQAGVLALARGIAARSPLAVAGTKAVLLHTRDGGPGGGVAGGLAHVALWNSAFLLSDDMARLIQARAQKRPPLFAKL